MSDQEKKPVKVTIVGGVAGPSVYINDRRVAGNKPWGVGKIILEWTVDADEIRDALPSPAPSSSPAPGAASGKRGFRVTGRLEPHDAEIMTSFDEPASAPPSSMPSATVCWMCAGRKTYTTGVCQACNGSGTAARRPTIEDMQAVLGDRAVARTAQDPCVVEEHAKLTEKIEFLQTKADAAELLVGAEEARQATEERIARVEALAARWKADAARFGLVAQGSTIDHVRIASAQLRDMYRERAEELRKALVGT